MYIKNIKLQNFRNYENLELKLSKNINIFYGNNGEGKTNILESIYISAITKSYRTNKDIENIKFNKEYTHIEIKYIKKTDKEENENNIQVYIDKNNIKKIKENGINIKKYSDYIGKYNVVLFSPENIALLKGSPKNRRNILNILISQISKKYLLKLQEYNKTILIKNNILKLNKIDIDFIYLDVIDEKLSELILYITKERKIIINKLLKILKKIHKNLTGENEKINLKYISEFKNKNKKEILDILKNTRNLDLIRKTSNKGIQRDDFDIYINDKDVIKYGSQGQNRTALLSLKLAESEILTEEKETKPILLLDDVFSELDNNRIEYLLKYIKNYQVIITTTDLKFIKNKKNINFFEVKNEDALQTRK